MGNTARIRELCRKANEIIPSSCIDAIYVHHAVREPLRAGVCDADSLKRIERELKNRAKSFA